MNDSFMAEALRYIIIGASLVAMGMMLTLAVRTLGDKHYWMTLFAAGYLVTKGIILDLVYRAPFVLTDLKTWAYAIALTLQAVGIIGWVYDYRKGLRLGRKDRIIYSDESAKTAVAREVRREKRQRKQRRGLAVEQLDIDGQRQATARETMEQAQSDEQEERPS